MGKQENQEFVRVVYKNHDTWLMQVAINLTKDKDEAFDLVQDLYLYLLEMKNIDKIRYNGTVNLFYLYKTLRSKFLNGLKQKNKLDILPIEEDFLEVGEEDYSPERDEEFERTFALVREVLDNQIHWFDKKLLETYVNEEHSIASLHEVTKISKSSIWTSLNKTKKFIQERYEAQQEKSGSL